MYKRQVLFKNLVLVSRSLVLELSSLRFLDLDLHLLPSLMSVLRQTLTLLKLFHLLRSVISLTFKVKQMIEKSLLLNLLIHLLHSIILDLSSDKVLKDKHP